ncbi:hypothetical protein GGI43DRAFT_422463 [Trichoderma evansii]
MEFIVAASVATISNEVTLAAASVNFDFTLIKVEAPKEYSGVSGSLSEVRRDDAENGTLHRTARKLGALFDGIPPSVECLLAAYGNRVSEISEKAKIRPLEERHGIFARFIGPDSGSLWAAATSGPNAIAIHLLACMIAEMFGGPESVALWYQLIERRKAEIENTIKDPRDPKDFAKLSAYRQEFSRIELASWDNSARSWIQTANKVTKDQRNTALLYTDQAGQPVNMYSDPYESVKMAWTDALSSMDLLIKGVPQKVRNGAILLAMRSWHLYPDLCVMSRGPDVIPQKDRLIPKSGIITIDLEHTDDSTGSISWSLPLSYLRYYGDPVHVKQTLGVVSNRISMDQFRFILLGCVISTWPTPTFTKSVDKSLDLLMTLIKALRWPERSIHIPSDLKRMQQLTSKTSWLGQILTAVEDLSADSEIERETARKLMEHGRRHGQFLCNKKDHPPPFFGLSIGYLRRYAKSLGLSNSNCVIRYFNLNHPEFATIQKIDKHFGSEHLNGYILQPFPSSMFEKFVRWISFQDSPRPCSCDGKCYSKEDLEQQSTSTSRFRFGKKKEQRVLCPCSENGGCSINCHSRQTRHNLDCLLSPALRSRITEIRSLNEECFPVHMITSIKDPNHGHFIFGRGENFMESLTRLSQDSANFVTLKFCIGSEREEILNAGPITQNNEHHDPRKNQLGYGSKDIGRYFTADFINEEFEGNEFDYYKLTEWFATQLRATHPVFTRTLRACASAVKMYGCLPDATVDPAIVDKISLADAPWIFSEETQHSSPMRLKLSRPEAFACVTMFECGRLLDVAHFREVFAITSNDTIFVATPLLADPFEAPTETEIKRVSGNIGTPGVSLLVPPPEPRIRKINPNWKVISHSPFLGDIENNFRKTSMHLSLTQYQQGLLDRTKNEHHIDNNTVLHEALIQVFDSSTWVGDLDLLSTLSSRLVSRVDCKCSNGGLVNEQSFHSFIYVFGKQLAMIVVDNWEELFTPPTDPGISVVRSAGNWIGRLAAVGVSIRLRRLTIVLPDNKCWGCTKRHIQGLEASEEEIERLVIVL